MLSLFFCYAPEDQLFCNELEKHLSTLKQQGLIQVCSHLTILAGEDVQTHVQKAITEAHIVLLLVSPDFLAADYLYGQQLTTILAHQEHTSLQVIPVLVRPVARWRQSRSGHLQALPRDEKPVSLWDNRDEAYRLIIEDIALLVEKNFHQSIPQQKRVAPRQPRSLADQVTQQIIADTGSRIENVKQITNASTAGSQSIEAHNQSSIAGAEQIQNNYHA
jgi:hypothetical protein